MEFLVDQFKFLGLNDREVRVFTALSTFGRMNMTKLSSRAGLSRTTVDAIVRRLVGQGLVVQEKVSGHFEYAVKLHEVADRLDWIEKRLRPGCGVAEGGSVGAGEQVTAVSLQGDPHPASPSKWEEHMPPLPQGEGGVRVAPPPLSSRHLPLSKGEGTHKDMHDVVGNEFARHAGERVMMLVAALLSGAQRLERFEHCLAHAREARIHLEMLTTTDVTKALSAYARELLALLTAYDLRLNFLPTSFCIEHTDIVAFRDVVLVVDHRSNTLERIEGERAVAAVNHLLRVAREAGWGMDMRMWLEGIIAAQ